MAAFRPEWAHWLQSWLAWQGLFYSQSLPATVCRDRVVWLPCLSQLTKGRRLKKIQVLIFSVELSSISGRLSSPDCLCRVWILVWKESGAAHRRCLGRRLLLFAHYSSRCPASVCKWLLCPPLDDISSNSCQKTHSLLICRAAPTQNYIPGRIHHYLLCVIHLQKCILLWFLICCPAKTTFEAADLLRGA